MALIPIRGAKIESSILQNNNLIAQVISQLYIKDTDVMVDYIEVVVSIG